MDLDWGMVKIVLIAVVLTSLTMGLSVQSSKPNEVRHGKSLENDCMDLPLRGTTEEAKEDVGV